MSPERCPAEIRHGLRDLPSLTVAAPYLAQSYTHLPEPLKQRVKDCAQFLRQSLASVPQSAKSSDATRWLFALGSLPAKNNHHPYLVNLYESTTEGLQRPETSEMGYVLMAECLEGASRGRFVAYLPDCLAILSNDPTNHGLWALNYGRCASLTPGINTIAEKVCI